MVRVFKMRQIHNRCWRSLWPLLLKNFGSLAARKDGKLYLLVFLSVHGGDPSTPNQLTADGLLLLSTEPFLGISLKRLFINVVYGEQEWGVFIYKVLLRAIFKECLPGGRKGASLGEMTNAGIPVPGGFVILADTFEQFIV